MNIGIDLGSRRVKIVLMEGSEIARTRSFDTLFFYKRYGTIRQGKLWVQFDRLDIPIDPSPRIFATGYGRNNINISGANIVTEIQAHTQGAIFRFAESEMIGKIVEGIPIPRICAGVNLSVVRRVLPLINRFPRQDIVVSGGVARNKAVLKLLGRSIDTSVIAPKRPAFTGAIGCALLSRRAFESGS